MLTHVEADRADFTARLPGMVREVGGDFTRLALHCFTDGRESLERVVQDRGGIVNYSIQYSSGFEDLTL